jgi:phage-related protein (TIGR01555 family)
MSVLFGAGVRDSLSNLAASLGAGRDKASQDAFTLVALGRAQIDAMYRGDWLARKVVDIVPYDSVRAWRAWSGHRADVERVEAAERRLGLRVAVQRAMTLGRLYGGGAVIVGDGEGDPAALARPLDEPLGRGRLRFLHAVSRWQLGASEVEFDPLSPWCGEPRRYTLSAAGRPALELHPSRVVRFLGNALPDPTLAGAPWSDSVLQALYDAVHAAALCLAGATSLLHEAKVDVVTIPNLSEHLSSAETTAQLSARFAYASAMKSINNLLLLGDGEAWSRQRVDFGGLPELARTFLQVAAGAADIPVTRLLGQSPAGLSATGESDVRNYYDMVAARQELDLRPQLERLDRLICASEGIAAGALSFAFRPLWQLDEASRAALALSRAQTTRVYAGLKLWPAEVVARLAEAQLAADGTYPNAAAVFAGAGAADGGRHGEVGAGVEADVAAQQHDALVGAGSDRP